MYKLGFEEAEESEIKFLTFVGSWRKPGNSRKTSTSASLTTRKTDCVDHNQLWKILKEIGLADHLTCLLRNLYVGQEATELGMEQLTGSKLRKEYHKAAYCHPAYLTSMQSEKKVKLLSHVRLFATPWTVAYQASQSMGFSRQEYWSGVPAFSRGSKYVYIIRNQCCVRAPSLGSLLILCHGFGLYSISCL